LSTRRLIERDLRARFSAGFAEAPNDRWARIDERVYAAIAIFAGTGVTLFLTNQAYCDFVGEACHAHLVLRIAGTPSFKSSHHAMFNDRLDTSLERVTLTLRALIV
jgi:hypothetical protein